MTVLRDDNFTRADEDPLASPYVKPTPSVALRLVSNAVGVSVANNDCGAYDGGSSYPSNHWSEVTISASGGRDFGPAVRMTAGGNYYFLTNVNSGHIGLYKVTGVSTFASLVDFPTTDYVNGDVLYLEAQGDATSTTVIAKRNGTTIITYVDNTSPFTGGAAGIAGFDGTWRVSRFRGGDFSAGGPTVSSTSSANPKNGELLTVTGAGFEAAQGTGDVAVAGDSQVETAWADAAITLRLNIGNHKFGVPYNVVVTTNGGLTSAAYALTTVQPDAGTAFVDVGTPAGSGTLTASPPAASGDQCQYEDFGGRVVVFSDLTFSADASIQQFRFRFFDASDSTWGAWATYTLFTLSGTKAQFDPEMIIKGWY